MSGSEPKLKADGPVNWAKFWELEFKRVNGELATAERELRLLRQNRDWWREQVNQSEAVIRDLKAKDCGCGECTSDTVFACSNLQPEPQETPAEQLQRVAGAIKKAMRTEIGTVSATPAPENPVDAGKTRDNFTDTEPQGTRCLHCRSQLGFIQRLYGTTSCTCPDPKLLPIGCGKGPHAGVCDDLECAACNKAGEDLEQALEPKLPVQGNPCCCDDGDGPKCADASTCIHDSTEKLVTEAGLPAKPAETTDLPERDESSQSTTSAPESSRTGRNVADQLHDRTDSPASIAQQHPNPSDRTERPTRNDRTTSPERSHDPACATDPVRDSQSDEYTNDRLIPPEGAPVDSYQDPVDISQDVKTNQSNGIESPPPDTCPVCNALRGTNPTQKGFVAFICGTHHVNGVEIRRGDKCLPESPLHGCEWCELTAEQARAANDEAVFLRSALENVRTQLQVFAKDQDRNMERWIYGD